MKDQTTSIPPFGWEITEAQLQKKKLAYFLEKFSFFFLFAIFIFPPLGIFMIIIAIIMFIHLKQNTNLRQEDSRIVEKYKIDDRGISINNIKQKEDNSYIWNDLAYFYSYSKTSPLFGLLLGKIVGEDFFIKDNNKLIKLSVSIDDTEKVRSMLSKKLEFKAATGGQMPFSSFQIKPKSGSASLLSKASLSNSSSRSDLNNVGFKNRDQEKKFHEQTISQQRNIRKEKEAFKRKLLIVLYIVVVFVVTTLYLLYKYRYSIINLN